MRKVTLGFAGLALAALAAVPVFAQEEPGTIADIVVASAGAETPEFAALLGAVSMADPAILEALSDPEAELTVFAPTDAAFAAAEEALGSEAFGAIVEDVDALSGVLLFHVVEGVVDSATVVSLLDANAEAMGMEDGSALISVPTLGGQYLDIARDAEGVITIDGAPLNMAMLDITASNGIVHVIDGVLLPESRTIAEIVLASTELEEPQFTTLLAAVAAADPAVLELLSDPEAEVTVFAPTDAAFAALGADTIAAVVADQAMVTDILQYHVLPMFAGSADVAALLEEGEGMVEIEMANGQIATVMAMEDGSLMINDATIIITDIDAANGIIHVIDAVLLPPTE
jgi:uncharacterized surface protein with fasciclin (FAS1) repeats